MSYHPQNPHVKATPWDAGRLGWLLLASFDGFGSRTLARLRKTYGRNGDAAAGAPPETFERTGCGPKTIGRFLSFRSGTNPANLALKLDSDGIRFLLFDDPEYPPLLREIADPPGALFVRGADIPPSLDLVAVVGTRNASAYGRRVATMIGGDLARHGIGCTSGLALGIDADVHASVVAAGGYAVAVLGSGVDEASLYPRHNLGLAHRILDGGGTLLSEFPPGAEGFKHHFPLRNRVIAGLSRATIVVEAAPDSGSLITAHAALEQNRDVFGVPGPITHAVSAGVNRLLAQGAAPYTGIGDLLGALRREPGPVATKDPVHVSDDERRLLRALRTPVHPDELSRMTGRPIAEVATLLTALEIKGLVGAAEGNAFALTEAARTFAD